MIKRRNDTTTSHACAGASQASWTQRLLSLPAALSTLLLGVLPAGVHAMPASGNGARAGCEAWLGDFAVKADAPAFVRIERGELGYSARRKADDGSWAKEIVPLTDVTHEKELDLSFAHGCVLAGDGALFIKAPKGTAYQATSITGQNFDTYHMGTDSLMLVSSGFQVDGQDLYRVAAQGESPPLPKKPTKAVVGKEVTTVTCLAGQSPVITQPAFDALPADYRAFFHRLEPDRQAEIVCGQRLHDLLTLDTYTSVELQANRAGTLAEAKLLLHAGEEPRDENGQGAWWKAASDWLASNRTVLADRPPIPLRAEYFTMFNEDILPRLPKPRDDERQLAADTAKYALDMPEAQAITALTRLQELGVLALPQGTDNVASMALAGAVSPGTPQAVFELLWNAAKPGPKNANLLFNNAVFAAKGDSTGVERLLRHGMDPGIAQVLIAARKQPNIYALLIDAAVKHAPGNKLPPEVADPLVRTMVTDDATIDWSAVELLLKHGGDLSRSFAKTRYGATDTIAYIARSQPKRFLELLDHGLRADQIYPPGGYSLLSRYLAIRIAWLSDGPRPDVVEALLKRHNNAATGKPCTDCEQTPLAIALGNKGPDSPAVVQVLLRYGADANARDSQGFPYFTYAIFDDRVDMLEAMNAGPKSLDFTLADPNGISPLAMARCHGAPQAESWLLQHGAGDADKGYEFCRKAVEESKAKPKKDDAGTH